MMSQVFAIVVVCNELFIYDLTGSMTPEYEEFEGWLIVELWVFLSTLFGNALFMFFRSIFVQRTHLKISEMNVGETTDYLESQQTLLGIFVSFVAPIFIIHGL